MGVATEPQLGARRPEPSSAEVTYHYDTEPGCRFLSLFICMHIYLSLHIYIY